MGAFLLAFILLAVDGGDKGNVGSRRGMSDRFQVCSRPGGGFFCEDVDI